MDPVRTKDDVPATAFRKLHSEVLDVAKEALAKVPVEKREFATSFTMIRPSHGPRVKELIRKFRASRDRDSVFPIGGVRGLLGSNRPYQRQPF